jgi:integrase
VAIQANKFRSKTCVAPSGERFVLVVDQHGIAHDPSTIYATLKLRQSGLSFNSQMAQLQAVTLLLNWASSNNIDLAKRIGECTLLDRSQCEALRKYLRRNQNRDKAKTKAAKQAVRPHVENAVYCNRINFVCNYVTFHAETVISRIPPREIDRCATSTKRLEQFKKMLLDNLPPSSTRSRQGLSPAQMAVLCEVITPGHPRNPFKPKLQHRNQALILLLVMLGLRRSEALKIKGEDMTLSGPDPMVTIVVRNDEPDDPRTQEPRAKTCGREISITPKLANIFFNFITKHRSKTYRAKQSPYVFLAQNDRPMATQTMNDIFRLLRKRVEELPDDFCPHILRHSWNDKFTEVADGKRMKEAEEHQARNYAMGWSKTSTQSVRYTQRHTKRRAAEACLEMQNKSVSEIIDDGIIY